MKTTIVRNTYNLKSVETYEGETIETKVARIVQEKAPITDGAPIIYTDREQGVQSEPGYCRYPRKAST